jgi:hypothetical protein
MNIGRSDDSGAGLFFATDGTVAPSKSGRRDGMARKAKKRVARKKSAAAKKSQGARKSQAARKKTRKTGAKPAAKTPRGTRATRQAAPARRTPRRRAAVPQLEEDNELQGLGPEAAGQSGDIQGLSGIPDADSESVEELAEEGQGLEADVIAGVEDAPDADSEVRVHERSEDDLRDEYLDRD